MFLMLTAERDEGQQHQWNISTNFTELTELKHDHSRQGRAAFLTERGRSERHSVLTDSLRSQESLSAEDKR